MNGSITVKRRLRAEWKTFAIGLVLIGVGVFLLYGWVALSWDQVRLIRSGTTTSGHITDMWEDVEDSDSGGTMYFHGGTYTYRLPDGRVFEGTISGSGRVKEELRTKTLPIPIEVEYLPGDPGISRIKGDGPDSIIGIFRHEVGRLWLCIGFLLVGGYVLFVGIRDIRRIPYSSHSP